MAAVLALLAGCAEPGDPWRTRGDRLLGLGGDDAEDPVSGARVEKQAAVKREYLGTTYFFESTETAEVFDRDPRLFAVPVNPPLEDRAERPVR
jgi:YHS domain-containing protein